MKIKRTVEVILEVEVEIDTELDPVKEQESIRDCFEHHWKPVYDSNDKTVRFESEYGDIEMVNVKNKIGIGDILLC